MTVNIDSTNIFEMTVNTPNVSEVGTVIEIVSQHSNDTLFRLDVDIVETNDRYTTVTCELPTDFYKQHYNGIYEYTLEAEAEVVDQGLVKIVTTPGGDFGKNEYISDNENRQAKVIYRPSYE